MIQFDSWSIKGDAKETYCGTSNKTEIYQHFQQKYIGTYHHFLPRHALGGKLSFKGMNILTVRNAERQDLDMLKTYWKHHWNPKGN